MKTDEAARVAASSAPGGAQTMRAMLLGQATADAPGSLELVERPVPVPGAGEVLAQVGYAGCNFADTMMWRGTYPHPKGYPLVAGLEFAGRVAAIGAGVKGIAVGDRIAAFVEEAGVFADYCIVPVERVIPIPDSVPLTTAASFATQALTAWHMLHTVASVRPGDKVLIHAIGGGVGLCLTQLAVAAGATVFGTIGTAGKESRALAVGATAVVNRSERDFVEAIATAAGGHVDKIYDSTGATILDRSFELIRPLGHIVSFGEAEGRPFPNLWERLVRKSLTFTRFHLGHIDFHSEAWTRGVAEVLGSIRKGELDIHVEQVFPLEDTQAMFERLESRQVSGKLLLSINPGV